VGEANLVERDYAKKALTVEELETIFGDDDLAPFLNTRHAVYKERGFAESLPSRKELFALIVVEPNLLRRPIIRHGKKLVIGFDKVALQNL
jgi:arsenate reductase-like glutaredoxin family protein